MAIGSSGRKLNIEIGPGQPAHLNVLVAPHTRIVFLLEAKLQFAAAAAQNTDTVAGIFDSRGKTGGQVVLSAEVRYGGRPTFPYWWIRHCH
jgi:hypothetical protein